MSLVSRPGARTPSPKTPTSLWPPTAANGEGEEATGSDDASVARAASASPPELLTVGELAALLRLHPKSAYVLIQEGRIPGVRRIGRVIRIHRSTVLAWFTEGQERGSRHPRR